MAVTAALNARIIEVKNKMPNITKLGTTAPLTVVENKTVDHSKYITIPEFNKLTAESFCCKISTSKFIKPK